MEKLQDTFSDFLNSGGKACLTSEQFKGDMESHLGGVEEPQQPIYRPIKYSSNLYSPDHDIGSEDNDDNDSISASFQDPLDDETSSIVGNLEQVALTDDFEDQWEGASKIIWPPQGSSKIEHIFKILDIS